MNRARARNCDRQAWDQLVDRYAPLVWSICRRHRLEAADAHDAAQTIWDGVAEGDGQRAGGCCA